MPKLWWTPKCSSLTARLDRVVLIAGALAVALASVALFGWYTYSPWLVQVRPTFAPMQYNAALSVLLGGLGTASAGLGTGTPRGGLRPRGSCHWTLDAV